MANSSSNPTPNLTEFKVHDFFPQSPDLSPEAAQNAYMQHQLDLSNMELADLKLQLRSVKAQMLVDVEESVMVSEAHLEQRMEEWQEVMKEKLEKDLDMMLKTEMVFMTAFVLFVSVCGAMIVHVFGS